MSKAQYDIYVRKVYDLAHTLVLKSRATADSINKALMAVGISVNDTDPSTWKYYLNLSGQYHATDTLMQVTSLDTLQTIDFTRENLQEHRTTYREYAYGSRYYNDLVSRYPSQEMLIRGILNPVDIATAVAAPDGRILHYDADLVEDNETNLIPKLSEWTEGFMVRWNVAAFTTTDDLYAAAQLAVLYMNLPPVIMNLRLANCHTRFAHSYHIRAYLASNGRLDEYVDHLTKKQMLWLYRNINYIHRNAGKQATFQWLIENILTARGLPLAEWSMRHNLHDQLTEIYPDIEFSRRQLNFGTTQSSAGADTVTLTELLNKEQPAAKGNPRVQPDTEISATVLMENSISNRLPTKVLESSILDMTDATVYTLSDCLLNHWLYLAALDMYNAVVVVENPKTGDTLALTTKEAFVVFLYAFNKARGLTLPHIPELQAINVRRIPTPTKATLRSMVESRLVPEVLINAAVDALTPIKTYISTISFYEAMAELHQTQLFHRALYVSQEHYKARVEVEMMVSHLYADVACDLGTHLDYATWFSDRGLDIPTFTELECDLLATSLLATATGVDLKAVHSLKEMQAAMLRLMAQLSSYSVQYLQSINSDPIQVVEWPAIRVGDETVHGSDFVPIDITNVRLQGLLAKTMEQLEASLDDVAPATTVHQRQFYHDGFDHRLPEHFVNRDELRIRIGIQPVRVLNDIEKIDRVADVVVTDTESYVPVNRQGLDGAFNGFASANYQLTSAERTQIQARWDSWKTALAAALPINVLGGLSYTPLADITTLDLDGIDDPNLDGSP